MPKLPSKQPPKTPGVAAGSPVDQALAPASPQGLARYVGFVPNDRQLEVRAAFWAHVRLLPGVDPKALSAVQVRDLLPTDTTGLSEWWREPGFKSWFLDGEEWRAQLELLLTRVLTRLDEALRHGVVAVKDLVAAGKFIAEAKGLLGRGAVAAPPPPDADPLKGKTKEELRAVLEQWALGEGWTPPSGWSRTSGVVATLSLEPESDSLDDDGGLPQ